jgi:uncharacterized membrane protein YfcA
MDEITLLQGLMVGVLAFGAEYIDSTLGMGYGTTLTPLLMLLFGFEPLEVVPAILLSELFTGFAAGFTHHAVGNVDVRPKTLHPLRMVAGLRRLGVRGALRQGLPRSLKVALVIGCCSVVGTVASVVLALRLPPFVLKLSIGLLVTLLGVVILASGRVVIPFSWTKLLGLGLVASFNKGFSGGGYGPVVTGGQLLSGVEGLSAVAITSLAEGLTCLVGVVAYAAVSGWGGFGVAPWLVVGALCSVPLSALTVRRMSLGGLRLAIGVGTLALGIVSLLKVL